MKVKIGDKIYDSLKEPIMFILSESDKKNIREMSSKCNKYCSFPSNMNKEVAIKFMQEEQHKE